MTTIVRGAPPNRAHPVGQGPFERARPGDIVLLLGKGHEGCIFYGNEKIPWDEAGAARAALRGMGYGGDKMTR